MNATETNKAKQWSLECKREQIRVLGLLGSGESPLPDLQTALPLYIFTW